MHLWLLQCSDTALTSIHRPSFDPSRQRRRGVRQPGSAPPGPIRASHETTLTKSGEEEEEEEEEMLTRRALFRTGPPPWDSAGNGFAFAEIGERGLAQETTGARKLAGNMPTDMGGGDGDEDGDGDGDGDWDGDGDQSPTLWLGVGTGSGGGGESESGDSQGSADIQNVRGSPESESSFALAPPGSAIGGLDSPTLGPRRLEQESGGTETGEYGDLGSLSIPRYKHLEQPAPCAREMTASSSLSPSPCPFSLVDDARDVSNDDWSYLPMAHTSSPKEEVEVVATAVSPPFSELLRMNLSTSRFSDSNDSEDFRGGVSHHKHASPSSTDEDTDRGSSLTDSSFESCREKSIYLPPRSELPFFPLTQDMLQVGLDNAEMSFTNPVYVEDV